MQVTLIAAVARDGCIGKAGDLPWRLPPDLKRFRELTVGKPVIMGRRTWDSLPRKPLPGRQNVVISRGCKHFEGATAAASLEEALSVARATGAPEACVIGGGEIYALAMPHAHRLELTQVDTTVDGGDAFFPDVDTSAWREVARTALPDSGPPADFVTFVLR